MQKHLTALLLAGAVTLSLAPAAFAERDATPSQARAIAKGLPTVPADAASSLHTWGFHRRPQLRHRRPQQRFL